MPEATTFEEAAHRLLKQAKVEHAEGRSPLAELVWWGLDGNGVVPSPKIDAELRQRAGEMLGWEPKRVEGFLFPGDEVPFSPTQLAKLSPRAGAAALAGELHDQMVASNPAFAAQEGAASPGD